MKKPLVLITNYARLPILELLALGRSVRDSSIFTNTTKYPSLPITRAALDALITSLQQRYDAARNRDVIALAEQDLADAQLLKALQGLARYAAPLVYNDKVAIEDTGFQPSEDEAHPAGALGQPTFTHEVLNGGGLRVNMGAKGEADAFTIILTEAGRAINVRMNADSVSIDGAAIVVTDTHAKMTISSVARRTTYTMQAFAVNSAGKSPLSNPVEVTTQ